MILRKKAHLIDEKKMTEYRFYYFFIILLLYQPILEARHCRSSFCLSPSSTLKFLENNKEHQLAKEIFDRDFLNHIDLVKDKKDFSTIGKASEQTLSNLMKARTKATYKTKIVKAIDQIFNSVKEGSKNEAIVKKELPTARFWDQILSNSQILKNYTLWSQRKKGDDIKTLFFKELFDKIILRLSQMNGFGYRLSKSDTEKLLWATALHLRGKHNLNCIPKNKNPIDYIFMLLKTITTDNFTMNMREAATLFIQSYLPPNLSGITLQQKLIESHFWKDFLHTEGVLQPFLNHFGHDPHLPLWLTELFIREILCHLDQKDHSLLLKKSEETARGIIKHWAPHLLPPEVFHHTAFLEEMPCTEETLCESLTAIFEDDTEKTIDLRICEACQLFVKTYFAEKDLAEKNAFKAVLVESTFWKYLLSNEKILDTLQNYYGIESNIENIVIENFLKRIHLHLNIFCQSVFILEFIDIQDIRSEIGNFWKNHSIKTPSLSKKKQKNKDTIEENHKKLISHLRGIKRSTFEENFGNLLRQIMRICLDNSPSLEEAKIKLLEASFWDSLLKEDQLIKKVLDISSKSLELNFNIGKVNFIFAIVKSIFDDLNFIHQSTRSEKELDIMSYGIVYEILFRKIPFFWKEWPLPDADTTARDELGKQIVKIFETIPQKDLGDQILQISDLCAYAFFSRHTNTHIFELELKRLPFWTHLLNNDIILKKFQSDQTDKDSPAKTLIKKISVSILAQIEKDKKFSGLSKISKKDLKKFTNDILSLLGKNADSTSEKLKMNTFQKISSLLKKSTQATIEDDLNTASKLLIINIYLDQIEKIVGFEELLTAEEIWCILLNDQELLKNLSSLIDRIDPDFSKHRIISVEICLLKKLLVKIVDDCCQSKSIKKKNTGEYLNSEQKKIATIRMQFIIALQSIPDYWKNIDEEFTSEIRKNIFFTDVVEQSIAIYIKNIIEESIYKIWEKFEKTINTTLASNPDQCEAPAKYSSPEELNSLSPFFKSDHYTIPFKACFIIMNTHFLGTLNRETIINRFIKMQIWQNIFKSEMILNAFKDLNDESFYESTRSIVMKIMKDSFRQIDLDKYYDFPTMEYKEIERIHTQILKLWNPKISIIPFPAPPVFLERNYQWLIEQISLLLASISKKIKHSKELNKEQKIAANLIKMAFFAQQHLFDKDSIVKKLISNDFGRALLTEEVIELCKDPDSKASTILKLANFVNEIFRQIQSNDNYFLKNFQKIAFHIIFTVRDRIDSHHFKENNDLEKLDHIDPSIRQIFQRSPSEIMPKTSPVEEVHPKSSFNNHCKKHIHSLIDSIKKSSFENSGSIFLDIVQEFSQNYASLCRDLKVHNFFTDPRYLLQHFYKQDNDISFQIVSDLYKRREQIKKELLSVDEETVERNIGYYLLKEVTQIEDLFHDLELDQSLYKKIVFLSLKKENYRLFREIFNFSGIVVDKNRNLEAFEEEKEIELDLNASYLFYGNSDFIQEKISTFLKNIYETQKCILLYSPNKSIKIDMIQKEWEHFMEEFREGKKQSKSFILDQIDYFYKEIDSLNSSA